MDWWLALLVAAIPAAIASVSLIVQQRFNARSIERADTSRRLDAEAERKHQERMLEAANRHAREQAEQAHRRLARDAWKADRRASHTRLLTRLEEIQAETSSALSRVSFAAQEGRDSIPYEFNVPLLPKEFVADVALVCSDRSVEAAQMASKSVAPLALAMFMLELLTTDLTNAKVASYVEDARNRLSKLNNEIAAYRQAAKQDIDTVD